MLSYNLEFILNAYNTSAEIIKSSLVQFAENLEIFATPQDNLDKGENFRICIRTQEPTIIFDICSQLGRIKTVKIDEIK